MENASRALVMAGSVLIAILILGALLLMFNSLSSYQNQENQTREMEQIVEFNNQFLPYEKDDLTLMELKSVYNKIVSNNKTNADNLDKIIDGIDSIKSAYPDIDGEFRNFKEEDKQNRIFKCTVTYNSKGYVSKMNFVKVK